MTGAPGVPLSATENGVMRGLGFKGLNRGAHEGCFLNCSSSVTSWCLGGYKADWAEPSLRRAATSSSHPGWLGTGKEDATGFPLVQTYSIVTRMDRSPPSFVPQEEATPTLSQLQPAAFPSLYITLHFKHEKG